MLLVPFVVMARPSAVCEHHKIGCIGEQTNKRSRAGFIHSFIELCCCLPRLAKGHRVLFQSQARSKLPVKVSEIVFVHKYLTARPSLFTMGRCTPRTLIYTYHPCHSGATFLNQVKRIPCSAKEGDERRRRILGEAPARQLGE